MEKLTAPETKDEALVNLEKMVLKFKIQKAFNRAQYDRTLGEKGQSLMLRSMHVLEMDYSELYGKEAISDN